jgi:hypothetical protein
VIVCEFEDSKTKPLGYSFHDLARFIQSKGYRLLISEWKPVQQYGGLHDWNRFSEYPCELSEEKAWGNIIATNSEFLYKALLTRAKRP